MLNTQTRWLFLFLALLVGSSLAGCAGTGAGPTGPAYSRGSLAGSDPTTLTLAEPLTLTLAEPFDVVVPVFDPGLPVNPDNYEKDGVWPELRRAESRRMALYVRDSIDEVGGFGAVRVTPDASASGDFYVQGKIIQSNGEDLHLYVTVTDSMGENYYSKTYEHRVKGYWYQNLRNKGKDPFEELYREVALDLKTEAARMRSKKSQEIRATTQLRFAQKIVPGGFSEMIVQRGSRYEIRRQCQNKIA